jgi:hypothetical protein
MIRSSVRFEDAPAHPTASPDNSANQSDNSNLLEALNINDDFSMIGDNVEELDKTVFEDSQYNRINFVGVTPHSKVVRANRDRKALQELMKIPTFASYNNCSPQTDTSNLFSKRSKGSCKENLVTEGAANPVVNVKNACVGNPLQSSTASFLNKTAANISNTSYHFELFSSTKQIETNHSQSVNNGPSVRFDEKSLLQNKLQTPSINRRKIQKTPIPSKTLLAKSLGSPINEDSDSDGSFSHKKTMSKHDLEASPVPVVAEDESNHSLDISRITPQNGHRYESSTMSNSNSNGSNNSPLSALVSRPDVSKSSPIVSSNEFHNKLMDHSTSYSRFSTVNTAKKETKEVATSYSPPAIEKTSHFMENSIPLDNPEVVASHHPISKHTTADTEQSSVSTSLEKVCGVAFGKGPLHSKLHLEKSHKHFSHVVMPATKIENGPTLPEVRVRSISNPDFLPISSSFVEKHENVKNKYPENREAATELSLDSSHHSLKPTTDPIHPATNWYTPRNTRKAPLKTSTKLPFGQNHLLLSKKIDNSQSSVSQNIFSNSSELFSDYSASLSTVGNHKSIQYPSFSSSSKPVKNGCDVSIQVDSDFVVKAVVVTATNQADESCALIELIKPEKEERSDQQQISRQPNFPYSSTFERKSKALPFDLSTCNIGGTPSTLASSANHNSSTSKLSFVSSGFPTPHLLNDNERKGHFYSSSYQNLSFSSTSHSLGTASRIPITIEKDDYRQIVWNEEEKKRRIESFSDYEHDENNSTDYINNDFINEITFLTDVAVANFTRENYMEEEAQPDNDMTFSSLKEFHRASSSVAVDEYSLPSQDPSVYSEGLETTFTVDHSALKKRNNSGFYPRLAIKSLKRDPSSHPFDVKEVGFETSPNELMTVMLSFKNDRQKDYHSIQLISKTIFLRREPLYSHRKNEEVNQQESDEGKDEIFIVSPETLGIPFNEEGMLFITFAPRQEGIYSGVLQIKYHKKSLTVLLRGESNKEFSLKKSSLSPTNQPLLRTSSHNQVFGEQRLSQHNGMNDHNHLLSSPETLQSYQPTLSLSTPPQLVGTAMTTPSSESSNEYLNHTPHGFHKKLLVLQQKISEISRKSKASLFSLSECYFRCRPSYAEGHSK